MRTYSISALARQFALSRSTLLYYHRIGLLPPSGRTASGYRFYTAKDRRRLDRICHFRRAGLALKEIRAVLQAGGKPSPSMLERRLRQTARGIEDLKAKQRLLASMLNGLSAGGCPPSVDKETWVEMLRAAGMDDQAMACWHAEFERRAPQAHHDFLLSLDIPPKEVLEIRQWSARAAVPAVGSGE